MQEKGCLTPRLPSALREERTKEGRREADHRGAQKKKKGKTKEMEDSKAHRSESMPGDLSEALKEATKEVHEQAESTEFMKNFQKGQVSLREFKMVMASLYYIYSALEEEIERNKDHPAFIPVYFPSELHRNAALQQDLEYFYGPSWREDISCPEATQKYVDRLHYVGQHEPELLVAHAYTRYLGDLSGGQVLKKIAQKALHLPSTGEGLEFFTFEGVSSATKFKQLYRSRINSIEMDPTMKKRVLEEAKRAFLLNIQVFEALQKLVSQPHTAQQKPELRTRGTNRTHEHGPVPVKEGEKTSLKHTDMLPSTPLVRWILAFSFLVTTVAVGLFAM